ncbi:UMP-CMP kinase-like [Convolutriloba macropyga]|uniref:UMP-CMP kinase-like n=1 Tax=Convolutriloba macropyga TaxID=536237 RepID=UPI003F525C24
MISKQVTILKNGLKRAACSCLLSTPRLTQSQLLPSYTFKSSRDHFKSVHQYHYSAVHFLSTMSDGPLNVLFVLGKPGSGKGTQCDRIISEFSRCRHLSAGDLLREKRKENDETSELIENYIKEGKIVPVQITISLLQKAMEKQQSAVNSSERLLFLIDGFPRNKDNYDGWNKQMEKVAKVHGVLFFNISDEVATDRCLSRGAGGSGRTDDNVESIKKRLNTYKDTATVIEQYRQQDIVSEFKGEATVDEIFAKVRDVVDSTLSKCA